MEAYRRILSQKRRMERRKLMATLQEFLNYLNSFVDRAIYVWGGQTQVLRNGIAWKDDSFGKALGDAEAWIKAVETNGNNANKVISLYRRRKDKFGVIPCVDCSGLGMNWLYNKTKTFGSDMTANGMRGKCRIINRSELKKGDWVFRVNSSGRATHIGYVVDDDLNVVHARGRAYGVVREPYRSSYWHQCGRPRVFEAEIIARPKPNGIAFKRKLKRTYPMMTGEDVKQLQTMLNEQDGAGLAVDGKFGNKTKKAVREYQSLKGLQVDGIAGINTISALGGIWNG